MNFNEFQHIVSSARLNRYLEACNGDHIKTIALYHANIRVSLEMFAIIGGFEIALRNAIDQVMTSTYGHDWLRNAVKDNGFFNTPQCRDHARIICLAYDKLVKHNIYTHSNLLAKMEFGVWKYMFSSPQYRASGRVLLKIFPYKPVTTRQVQYNNTTVFNELDHVNSLRNRIAHHEPICFPTGKSEISTDYINWIYAKISMLFKWMGIDSSDYNSRTSNLSKAIDEIEALKNS